MPIPLGILAVAGAGAGGAGAFDLLETTLLSSNTTSVTFSNLNTYSDYRHLQIRSVVRGTGGNQDFFRMRFNGATTGYAWHQLIGNGSSVASYSGASQGYIEIISRIRGTSSNTNANSAIITDILDFSNTNKNKTVRSLGGAPIANSGDPQEIDLASGLWNNTAAITSIEIYTNLSSSLAPNSRFSLYGIK